MKLVPPRRPQHAGLYLYALLSNMLLQRGIFVLYLLHRGLSALDVGILQTALYISVSLASIPAGLLVDRVGGGPAAGLGQLVVSACLISQVLAPSSLVVFLVLFCAQGVGFATTSNAQFVILYEVAAQSPAAESAYPVIRSRFSAVGATALAVAVVVGGLLRPVSWTLVYLVSSAAVALAGVLAPALLRRRSAALRPQEEAPSVSPATAPSSWRMALRAMGGSFFVLLVVSSLLHATLTPFLIFSQDILASQHLVIQAIAVTMAGVYALGALAPLLAPRVMRRLSTTALASATLVILTIGLLVTSAGLGGVTVVVLLIAASLPEVTAISLDFAIQDRIASEHRGVITGVTTFVESLAIAGSYIVFGALTDAIGPSRSAGAFAVLPLAALVLVVAFGRFGRRRRHTPSRVGPDRQLEETIHDLGAAPTQF